MKLPFKRAARRAIVVSFFIAFAARVSAQYSPPTSGLVGWWRADGNGNDSSGGGHTGTLNGGSYDTGKFGQAFKFAGNGNTFFVPDSNDFNLTNSLSVGAWIYPTANSWHVVERARSGLAPYSFGLDNAGHFWFVIDSGGSGQAELRAPIAYNQWKQVTATLDGSTGEVRLYFDGVLVTNRFTSVRPANLTPSGSTGLGIGNTPFFGGFPFIGLIDEVVLYSRALSPAEVQSLAATPPSAPGITIPPTNQTVSVGGSAFFGVSATGTAPLAYQWTFNGTNMAGATNSRLVLTNVQLPDSGSYIVQITNGVGSTSSAPAILTVVTQAGPYSVPMTGLVGWWRGEGNGNDSSGNGHTGTLQNGGGYDVGKFGQSFSFLGNANRLVVPDANDLNLTNSFSIGAWIYPKANSWHVLERAGFNSVAYSFGLDDAGQFWFLIDSGNGQAELRTPITFNQWKQVTATLDGATGDMRLYFDGLLVTNRTTTVRSRFWAPSSNSALGIGNTPFGGGFPFIGLVDEVLLYSRTLSPAEIQALAQAPAVAPFIRTQPTNRTATVGGTAAFIVDADGSQPLSYQWTFNGISINFATNSSLNLTNVQLSDAGTYAAIVTNALGSTNTSNATLTVNFPTALVRLVGTTNSGGSLISLPVLINANGNENALGFSLSYSTSRLAYASTVVGTGATNASLIINSSQTNNGRLGIIVSVAANSTFAAGTRELVQIQFETAVTSSNTSTPVTFADTPIIRQLSDVNGTPLPVGFSNATVALTATDLEGDLSPRPDGDHVVTVADFVLAGRYAAQLDFPTNASEFQRADCAPRATLGDGSIGVSDWVQAGRYAAGLDSPTPAGGPLTPVAAAASKTPSNSDRSSLTGRMLRVVSTALSPGETGWVPVELTGLGDENALGFSVAFDPAQFVYVGASAGSNAANANLNLNTTQAASGRVAAVLALPTGSHFNAGKNEVLKLSLQASPSLSGLYPLSLADQPVRREIADMQASDLDADYGNGVIAVNAQPSLRISRSGTNILLAWPEWASSFVVQESSSALSAQNWSSLTNEPVLTEGEKTLRLPLSATSKLYRLRAQ